MNYQTQQLRDLLRLLSGSISQKHKRIGNRNKSPTMNFITMFIIFTNSKTCFDFSVKIKIRDQITYSQCNCLLSF